MATTYARHADRLTQPDFPAGNMGDWQGRHRLAVHAPRDGEERSIVWMLRAWLQYADSHRNRFESGIGEDYILGPKWETIGRGILGLLNGETGRLDCGTLDGCIRSALVAEGFSEEG